ncbi:MAG TPA: tyrosine-type recombinase/integrase [Thermoleophilia bacterium]|nr:tyrosine-type recombinase/integrase [Thermoleophilia bacterium]
MRGCCSTVHLLGPRFGEAAPGHRGQAYHLHELRHTLATLRLQAGIHPKVVSERLGHATVSITLDTYSHAIPAMQEEEAERIAGLMFAESGLPLRAANAQG